VTIPAKCTCNNTVWNEHQNLYRKQAVFWTVNTDNFTHTSHKICTVFWSVNTDNFTHTSHKIFTVFWTVNTDKFTHTSHKIYTDFWTVNTDNFTHASHKMLANDLTTYCASNPTPWKFLKFYDIVLNSVILIIWCMMLRCRLYRSYFCCLLVVSVCQASLSVYRTLTPALYYRL